ncbi:MAG: O-antigen ligase family protein [Clostridia bacterium]|nr:O-antigen ligase family protein [Clostridia bacterium]
MKITISVRHLLLLLYAILLTSRIAVIIGDVQSSTFWIVLQILYICIFLAVYSFNDSKFNILLNKKKNISTMIMLLLILHTVLWGIVITNDSFKELIFDQFLSQMIFLLVLISTVLIVKKYNFLSDFIKVSYYCLSFFLVYHFLKYINELDLSGVLNIFKTEGRIRANFGFGHYNTLGISCVCNICLIFLLKDKKQSCWGYGLKILFLIVSILMLLCSASRNALISILIYGVVLFLLNIERMINSKTIATILKVFIVFSIFAIVAIVLFPNFNVLMSNANRATLFKHAIPELLKSGRWLFGLGYASNTSYGMELTGYQTYWLDNAYVYYLVTTGVLGFILILVLALIMFRKLLKNTKDLYAFKQIFSMFCMYLFWGMFEPSLFQCGVIANYSLLVVFLVAADKNNEIFSWKRIEERKSKRVN